MNKKGFILSFLICLFSFIGSVNALDNTNDGFVVNGVTINNELIDNIWSNLEGKTQHDIIPNYSDNTYVYHKENLPYMYIESVGSSVLIFFSPTNEFLSWYSTNRIARLNSNYVVRIEIYNGNFYYTFDRVIYTTTYNNTSKAITNFDFYDNNNNLLLSKSFDYESNVLPYQFNFHLNGGHASSSLAIPVIPILLNDTEFSISTEDYDIDSFLQNLHIDNEPKIFENFYYDSNFTHPFSAFDNFDEYATIINDEKVIDLYAKYRYENASDFLNNTNFNSYTFDTNYDYAIINRGNKTGSIYIGLPVSSYDLEIYEYDESNNTVKNGSSACLVPIFSNDGYYYYELNTLFTTNQEVLLLPKSIFDFDNYSFYLTDNAYISYTNDLSSSIIVDSNGNSVSIDLQESFETSKYYQELYSDSNSSKSKFKSSFSRFINPIKFIFKNVTNLYNNYINSSMQHYFFLVFSFMLIILIIRVIFQGGVLCF